MASIDDLDTRKAGSELDAGVVHIRVQQRNGKKAITTVQGLNPNLNFVRLTRAWREKWGCAANVVKDPEFGNVVQLQGNWADNIKQFLIEERLAPASSLRIHSL
eukprot:CAMPEP_0176433452 /NCGR_PEP_ID=MMETSP0127-20121128/16030_1 /TAXON_ID=938130 /ORGANISM="Platyophrya macrostoma, Strain WH" /LENGTH=103 /DNA_ID=CAMNT_0017815881 /DNA_START=55 /DNA_END=366 /DNA_ORIENTATION=+